MKRSMKNHAKLYFGIGNEPAPSWDEILCLVGINIVLFGILGVIWLIENF